MPKDIKTTEWTMLVVTEDEPPEHFLDRRCIELRYAFSKRDTEAKEWVRCGVSKFCEHTTGRAPAQEEFSWQIPHCGTYPMDNHYKETTLPGGPEHIYLAMNTLTNYNEVRECEMDEINEIIESFVENSQDP